MRLYRHWQVGLLDEILSDFVMIAISVAYVAKNGQLFYQELTVKTGTTIKQAIEQSAIFEDLDADIQDWLNQTPINQPPVHKAWYVGVFSQKKSLGDVVQAGDRVELYRPLVFDPKNARQNKVRADGKKLARLRSMPKFSRK